MSTINVTNLSGRGGGTPNLPDGAVISGVATITNLKPTNVSVSGAVTATTFDGSLKSTGTPTLGLGVTINSSGINVSGVLTATSFVGSGSGLTGVGETIAPWHYNPDVNDTSVQVDTGIGITFNKKLSAGSGTATLKVVNAGTAGTTIQSWGISSATIGVTDLVLGSLVSPLVINQTYQLDIPSGFIVDTNSSDYAGTAYTFTARPINNELYTFGSNENGQLGQNSTVNRSSPVQVLGTVWKDAKGIPNQQRNFILGTTDGTLYVVGRNTYGQLGQNNRDERSSPTQIPGTTWTHVINGDVTSARKSDGTLWVWGANVYGELGQNEGTNAHKSSPVQIPGTTWTGQLSVFNRYVYNVKSDGTLWAWGENSKGQLGQNNRTHYSSPVQIGSDTTWSKVEASYTGAFGIKTDGTLWGWGDNEYGQGGHNNTTEYSSPKQVGSDTTWSVHSASYNGRGGVKTDGTLWVWGDNYDGELVRR